MGDDVLECQQNFKVHDAMLQKHDEEITRVNLIVAQLPIQVGHIAKQIEELVKTLKEQSQSVVSKEFYEARRIEVDRQLCDMEKQIDELGAANAALDKKYDAKVDSLKMWIYGAVIGSLATVSWAFLWKHFSGG